ncbi:MAG: GNAT family N-acetyltransferase [Chloroflexota bacterium]
MSVQIVEYNQSQVLDILEQLTAIYTSAFSLPPYNENPQVLGQFSHSLKTHLNRKGFLCLVIQCIQTGRPVGFAYGYTARPGQWWYNSVTKQLTPEQVHIWFSDCFEVVDLALLPEVHGQGLGSRLHDELIQRLPHRTAALSTISAQTTALHLYQRRDWQILDKAIQFSGIKRSYMLLGKELR